MDNIANNIMEFHYDTENGKTLALWHKRSTDIFQNKLSQKLENLSTNLETGHPGT